MFCTPLLDSRGSSKTHLQTPLLQAEQTCLHCMLCALAVAVVLHWTSSSTSMPLSYWGAQNGTAAGVVPPAE